MPSVQVEDVPDETHAVLRRRAAAAHQSLQEYLRARLIADAARPTSEEVFARIEGGTGGVAELDTVLADLRADRAGHRCQRAGPVVLDDGEAGRRARARVVGAGLGARELVDLEVASVVRRQVLRGAVTPDRGRRALTHLVSMPISRSRHGRVTAAGSCARPS